MKKFIISVLASLTLATTFSSSIIANAQTMVWVEKNANGTKYHLNNPGRRFGKGKVNHHWSKVTISWAKQHGYTQSLR